MCIKKYRISRGIAKITPLTFDRETVSYLHNGSKRVAKRGNWDNYYDTWEDAKEAIVSRARLNVKGCTNRLQHADKFLHLAQAIEKRIVNKSKE